MEQRCDLPAHLLTTRRIAQRIEARLMRDHNDLACGFCAEPVTPEDQLLYHIKEAKWIQGQQIDDEWEWTAGGDVVSVCTACRESMREEYEPNKLAAIDRYGSLMFKTLMAVIVAASVAVVVAAATRR